MFSKLGLNATAYFFTKLNAKTAQKVKVHYVESLPINSKITVDQELTFQEGEYVVVENNIYKIAQRIVKKHPVQKTFWSCEYQLTFVDYVNRIESVKNLIKQVG